MVTHLVIELSHELIRLIDSLTQLTNKRFTLLNQLFRVGTDFQRIRELDCLQVTGEGRVCADKEERIG